ncbi:MAG: hypothetical protein JXR91_14110 [Deltaproteobacteria bacterium]|nr:hypothetical protein [Deltaproteobacteria bacterium]
MNSKSRQLSLVVVSLGMILGGAAAWFLFMFTATDPVVEADINEHFTALSFNKKIEDNIANPQKHLSSKAGVTGPSKNKSLKNKNKKKRVHAVHLPGIERIAPGTFFIDTALFEDAKKNTEKYIGSTKAIVIEKSGKPVGLQLEGITRGSYLHVLGLRNYDILDAVNGHSLSTPQGATAAVAAVIQSTQFRLDLKRGEKHISLYYRLK